MWFSTSRSRSLPMSATHTTDSPTPAGPVLYLAFELGRSSWKLAFTIGAGQKPRLRSLAAGSLVGLAFEIKNAKERFGLPPDGPVGARERRGGMGSCLEREQSLREMHRQAVGVE